MRFSSSEMPFIHEFAFSELTIEPIPNIIKASKTAEGVALGNTLTKSVNVIFILSLAKTFAIQRGPNGELGAHDAILI